MPTVAGNAQHFFGFGGDDDFYILCIGIHINQAVKEDDVFGNCSNLCGSWNKYERVHNPSTENHSNPMVSSEAAMATLRSNMWRPTGGVQQLSATNLSGDSVVQQPLPLPDGLGGSFHFNRSNCRGMKLRKIG